MAAWSQSPFLQALGWAMLNSFWQMAVLYLAFSVLQHLVRLSSIRKYYLAIAGIGAGFCWFAYTFFVFFQNGASGTLLAQHSLAPTSQTWNLILSSVSVAYLLLLLLPAYRLFKNWRYIEHLKKFGLQKTAMEYRLFVKKVAQRLGIRHTVHVYLSHLVQSPVTVGYLKPIILLPIAAVNNLSTQQVEAVLLHELSHIRRYDYLINFIITFFQTLFYFNPFVKMFVSQIEFEREKCCDELVLQFQYDKISYASALLLLEKNVLATETLAVAAAGKKHLLYRIEKIVGIERKARLSFQQFAGLLASFVVILLVNSLLFVNKEVKLARNHTFTAFENPLYQFESPAVAETFSKAHVLVNREVAKIQQTGRKQNAASPLVNPTAEELPRDAIEVQHLVQVAYDASDALVTPEEKEQISRTLETTKKVLAKTKWKEVEATIADGMTASEKKAAKKEYLQQVNTINWKALESRLKSQYQELDWTEISSKLNGALAELKLDSIQTVYHQILTQINKAETEKNCKSLLPVPDVSKQEVNVLKNAIQAKIDSITIFRERKVINF